jgi:hypothetical protein
MSTLAILRPLRHVTWVALVAACATASACSNSAPQSPDGFLAATMDVGAMSPATLCNFGSTQQWLDIGTATGGKPTTVQDGSQNAGATVHVTCTVSAVGSGFDVLLSATQGGLMGGSVTISSTSGQGAVTASGGTVHASFQSGTLGDFTESDCQISYTYQGQMVPDSPPIAAGRIWGHVSCPTAQNSGSTVMLPDGGSQFRQCDGEADFLFEQCGQ